jgi:DNA-binding transcriptional MerR regulator
MQRTFSVAQAAAASGVTPRAVRLYEAKGLVGPAMRAANGYRTFSDPDVERLRFVRRARALGLSLDAIADILNATEKGPQLCDRACSLLDERLTEIDTAIDELLALRAAITAARQRQPAPSEARARWCPVIEHE